MYLPHNIKPGKRKRKHIYIFFKFLSQVKISDGNMCWHYPTQLGNIMRKKAAWIPAEPTRNQCQ